jgi:hypothetical protein
MLTAQHLGGEPLADRFSGSQQLWGIRDCLSNVSGVKGISIISTEQFQPFQEDTKRKSYRFSTQCDGSSLQALCRLVSNRNPCRTTLVILSKWLVLALLWLTLHDHNRAWKGSDLEVLHRLNAEGWIYNPQNKVKAVWLTEEGLTRSASWIWEYFSLASTEHEENDSTQRR